MSFTCAFDHCIHQVKITVIWTVASLFVLAIMILVVLFFIWRAHQKHKKEYSQQNEIYKAIYLQNQSQEHLLKQEINKHYVGIQ